MSCLSTWLRTYEKKNQIRIDHIHTINTLRLDLLRYAHDADHLTDESGELVLNAAGKSQPGHFRSLLREDQLLWDRMVEDPGPLPSTLRSLFAWLLIAWLFIRSPFRIGDLRRRHRVSAEPENS